MITLNGASIVSINVGDPFVDQGATARDDVDGTVVVSISGSVNTAVAGIYTIIYSATDNAGNFASAMRMVVVSTVEVADTVPPVITLNGASIVSINVGDPFTDSGAIARDDVDGTVAVSISGSVNTAVAGIYTITYSATDNAGNFASAMRMVVVSTVEVADTVPPVITLNGPSTISINVGDPFVGQGATARDDVDGTVFVSTSGYVDTAIAGIYEIVYSAMDDAGNFTSVTLTVHVNTVLRLDQSIDIGADVIKVFGDADFTRNIQNLGLGTGAISCSSSDETIATTIPNNDNGGSCQITLIRGRSAKYSFDNTITINVEKAADTLYNTAVDSLQLTVQGVIHDFTGLDIRDGQCGKFDTTLGKMVMTQDGVGVLDLNHPDGSFNIQPGNTNVNHFCVAVEYNEVYLVAMGRAPVWYRSFSGIEYRYAATYHINSRDRRLIAGEEDAGGFFQDNLNSIGVFELTHSTQEGNNINFSAIRKEIISYTFLASNDFGISEGTIVENCSELTRFDRSGLTATTIRCPINGTQVIVNYIPLTKKNVVYRDNYDNHSCAIKNDDGVVCWGANNFGQTDVPENLEAKQVAIGSWHSCALKLDNSVVCWGHGYFGQTDVPENLEAKSLELGRGDSCAIRIDDSVVCWGSSYSQVPNNLSAKQIGIGPLFHSCALKLDNSVVCWGSNRFGQTDVPIGLIAKQISVSNYHSCAIRDDDSVVCWGYNLNGQTNVPEGLYANQIASNLFFSCARELDNNVVCWRDNISEAYNVPENLYANQIALGGRHGCALRSGGDPVCWGWNADGQTDIPSEIVIKKFWSEK